MKNRSDTKSQFKYFQLYEILVEKITSGQWRPNDLLPTERVLCQRYDLSRITVRDALDRMEEEGYVSRVPDKEDRRAVRVVLTEKGREFDRRHLSNISTNDHLAMQGIEGEDEETLMRLLSRIRDNLLEK